MKESERVYQALRGLIVRGEFRSGEVVNQVEIASRLKTSRSVVHEAVARLTTERMLSVLPGRGVRVTRPSVADLLEINQVRWLLEGFAARVATEQVPDEDIRELQEEANRLVALASYSPEEVEALDARVHQLLADYCGNGRMRAYVEQLDAEMSIARHADVRAVPAEMVRSVQAILAALEKRDPAAVEREVRDHIDLFADRLTGLIRDE